MLPSGCSNASCILVPACFLSSCAEEGGMLTEDGDQSGGAAADRTGASDTAPGCDEDRSASVSVRVPARANGGASASQRRL